MKRFSKDEYHRTLFDLYTLIKCLKLNQKLFDDSNVEFNQFVKAMDRAHYLLRDHENYN